ncbi:MAG: ADP-ribosylation factor-like protein [Promethearchaeota archaeon]
MDQFLEKSYSDLRALFKSDVNLDDKSLEKILDLPCDKLRGIDAVSKEKLAVSGLNTIYDLSQATEELKVRDIDRVILKKWVRKARIIINYVQNPLTKRKLLLVGLDYAGKTSVLSVLKHDYSLINDLLPTKGAQRDGVEFFGIPIISWDLGGQALYRKDYMDDKKSKLYFSETDVVFYVIDVQDAKRYDEAVDYYKQMLQVYQNLGETPTIIVLFNKLDPDLHDEKDFLEKIARLQVEIADLSTEFDLAPMFVNTSIHDKNSVFVAFSLGIRNISQTAQLVSSLLEEYGVKANGKSAVLLSSEGEVFAQTGVTKELIDMITHNGLLLDALLKFNVGKGLNVEKNPVLKFSDNDLYLIGHQISSSLNRTVFLWLLVENLVDFTSSLKFFKHEVEPLLNLFII